MLRKLVKKLLSFHENPEIVTLFPKTKDPKGRVLFSYIHSSINKQLNSPDLSGHSNQWESREIAKCFNKLGYIVDAIDWQNNNFHPTNKYDIVFDIYTNLQRLAPLLDKQTRKILLLTGSHVPYQNRSELKRVKSFEASKKTIYSPRRFDPHGKLVERSIQLSDHCLLMGNQHTLNTFPKKYHHKITLTTVSASSLNHIKTRKEYVPPKREFLWFFGGGNVHKGLDLVLDFFGKNNNFVLNIVGTIDKEFFDVYKNELVQPNIKYHGYLEPRSKKFVEIGKNIFCFIAPTCSEGISPAVATCLQFGFFPIISRETGITLPKNNGFYLKTCSPDEIEDAVKRAYTMDKNKLENQIFSCQQHALKQYSRERFTTKLMSFLTKTINISNGKKKC